MKYLIALTAASFLHVQLFATEWQIEAGGGANFGTPYFDPQYVTIMQNDIVTWTWVTGQHNVAATAGPESFNSGTHFAPYTWSFTFTLPGSYDFVCSLFEHENTQFGTITVEALPTAVANLDPGKGTNFLIWPNPASQSITIEKEENGFTNISIADMNGKVFMRDGGVAAFRRQYDISHLQCGIYFVELLSNGLVSRKKLVVS